MLSSVKTFEAKLDKYWNEQPVKFDYKEELQLQRSGHRGKLLPATSTFTMVMMVMIKTEATVFHSQSRLPSIPEAIAHLPEADWMYLKIR